MRVRATVLFSIESRMEKRFESKTMVFENLNKTDLRCYEIMPFIIIF